MNSTVRATKLVQVLGRQFSRTSVNSSEAVPARIQNLRANQKKFQIDDGLPVHLKGGMGDKILYQFTMGLCLVGLAGIGKLFFELSVPRKG